MNQGQKSYKKISISSSEFPSQLREIPSPPKLLYVRGTISATKPMIGVVGTRKCTSYGKRATESIVKELARAGVVIVSGMANGIDTEAHIAALEGGGETIAVVGSGVDESVIYPRSNVRLAREIERHGAVLSEFDPLAKSETYFFPQRNRIISGLSLGVIVVEAGEKSGALITANYALEQNRDVFAVPGSIYAETSIGTNNLIKQGAKCVTSVYDVLEELNIPMPGNELSEIASSNPIEERITRALVSNGGDPMHIDKIIEFSQLSAQEVSSSITMMELSDKVQNLGGSRYVIKGVRQSTSRK